MIVHPKPTVWEIFSLVRLSVLPRIAWQLVAVVLISIGVVLAEHRAPTIFHSWGVAPFTLLGVALSIFLGFRNSACYDRWWEARRQLGALIGETRSLARLTTALPGIPATLAESVLRETIGFVYSLMAHLRGTTPPETASRYTSLVPPSVRIRNLPDAMLRAISDQYGGMLARGEIGEQTFCLAEERLRAFAAIQVACERIRSTPTPYPYTLLIHRTAYAYCFLLPFGVASAMHWGTPFFCALVAYAFFGLDALGDELEAPFGDSLNALPLDAMARTVEISLLEAMGAEEVPPPLQPVRSVLR